MEIGLREFGAARCVVGANRSLPPKIRARVYEVSRLECDEAMRGNGYATALLTRICAEADAENKVLLLQPGAYGEAPPVDDEALCKWYARRFGFKVIQTAPVVLMAREPGAEPAAPELSPIAAALLQVH